MATTDNNRSYRVSLAAITSDPERALLHGRKAFSALPGNATPLQQASVLERMLSETAAIKTDSPGRAFVAAHGALDLAGQMPDGAERTLVKKAALQTMGGIATETYDSGNQGLGGRMYEKARELAMKAGFGYDSDVAKGVKLARGEPVVAPEPPRAQAHQADPRRGRSVALEALQRDQNAWRDGQSADLTAGGYPQANGPTRGDIDAASTDASGNLSGGTKRTKLSPVGDSPNAAPKKKGGWGKRLVVMGIAGAVAFTALTTYQNMERANADLTARNQALRQIALDQAARGRAAVQVDPYWAQQAGMSPDMKSIREQLETFRSQHPTEFNQIAVDMKRTGAIEGGLNRLAALDPQTGPQLRTQALAFVASASGPGGENSAAAGSRALISAFDEVNFNGQQADALRRGQVPRPGGAAGPGLTPQ